MSDTASIAFAYHGGRAFGKYILESLIGRGGMAEVYKSRHPDLDREVAVKVLHPFLTDTPGFVERFRREARAAASLRHPNIVQIYDFDVTADGLYYMVMEYIDGESFDKYLLRQPLPLPPAQTMDFYRQICGALQVAHEKGVVHRDIKPANIMVDREERPYLADFGIAQIVGDTRLTQSGMSTGTPQYMSPEQVTGGAISPATDIYALGTMLYQLSTGHLPFEGGNPATVMMNQVTEPPELPRTHVPDISPALESVILKALAKEPEERFENAAALWQALAAAKAGTAVDIPIPTGVRTKAGGTAVHPASADTAVSPEPQPTLITAAGGTPRWVWPVVAVAAVALVAVGFLLARGSGATPPAEPTAPGVTSESADVLIPVGEDTAVPTPTQTAVPTETPLPSPTPTPTPPLAGMRFVPGGTFMMGNAQGNADEQPPHEVTVGDFFMDETEVTNAAYAQFVAETGHAAPAYWRQPDPSQWQITAQDVYIAGDVDDPFMYDGVNVQPVTGTISMTLDADTDKGVLTAVFTGTLRPTADEIYAGTFRIEQDFFFDGPPFPAFKEGGIGDLVHMHGQSGNELAMYPEMTAYIGTWGTADLYFNDELLFPDLGTHLMYSDGVRDDTAHFIRRADGQCCFSPSAPADSSLDPDDREISYWLFPGTDYAEAQNFWIALHFEDITELLAPAFLGPAIYPEGQELYPATNVTWDDAVAYCEWIDGRLPTEAEWEYGARGSQGFLYPWGDERGDVRNNSGNVLAGTAPVGSFREAASPFGLQDMAGNVWEWTADWYNPNYYAQSPAENPTGPANGTEKVARGGGFQLLDFLGLDEARTTHRLPLDPAAPRDDVGFRCAVSATPQE
ncbi:MAG: SUMF1/EgtB/PvdO family nonheme iron enzyme [Anaerolineae bacterium]|nr:SUMF1/EgtB/PvdO family nonheme iron enzyme [Anaerolineae bacterium]